MPPTASPRQTLRLPAVVRPALIGALLGLLVGWGHYLLLPPQYSATALLVVVPRVQTDNQGAAINSLNQMRWSQALARIATNPQISGDRLRAAGLAELAEQPERAISTSAAPDTAVFSITSRMPKAEQAAAATAAVAAAVTDLCRTRQLPACARALGESAVSATPAPGLPVRLAIGLSVGAALGFLLTLIRIDRSVDMTRGPLGSLAGRRRGPPDGPMPGPVPNPIPDPVPDPVSNPVADPNRPVDPAQ